ncbi:NAD(P)-binding domain-containing protein [Streptomyces bohaiensis]|uniref:NAD(P)-binding domain-containing protein n=1 Tax=Streptomyces bohaiensis TaxID=1431344 RepID=UPI0030C6A236
MHDLVVVGAGPYGLSIASHAAAAGLDIRVLGRPMASWRDHMPEGMFLKSEPWSSNLSDPGQRHTLAAYCAPRGLRAEHASPLPIRTFSDYGMWFADQLQPRVEEVTVTHVARTDGGFSVTTAEEGTIRARSVVLAIGVMPFVNRPGPLRKLPPQLASHSSDHGDLSGFLGLDVTVVGAGQAALETAALLAEAGARPQILARAERINWNTLPQPLRRPPLASLREPHSGLGTGWSTWAWSELPWAVRRLPSTLRVRIADSALGPAGAWWLRDRVEGVVPAFLCRSIVSAEAAGGGVRLRVAGPDGTRRTMETGHVVAATGFVPELDRLAMLSPSLRAGIRTTPGSGAPWLGSAFESSVPGLFFAGLLSAPSFGPAMRFVHGATFTAGRLVRGVRRHLDAVRPAAGGAALSAPGANTAAGLTAGRSDGERVAPPRDESAPSHRSPARHGEAGSAVDGCEDSRPVG